MSSKHKCRICKNYFPPDEMKYISHSGNICSEKCLDLYRKKIKQSRTIGTGTCEECGKSFQRRKDSIGKHPHTYCGFDCATIANARKRTGQSTGRRPTSICEYCKKVYELAPSSIGRRRFCSRKCSGSWNAEQPHMATNLSSIDNSGKRNGRYKHGNRVGVHITKRNVRVAVIERDGDWCLYCGKPPKGLHLHRVAYGSEGGQYKTDNCVQLCAYHHELMHTNKFFWKPLLKEYIRRASNGESRVAAEEFRTHVV